MAEQPSVSVLRQLSMKTFPIASFFRPLRFRLEPDSPFSMTVLSSGMDTLSTAAEPRRQSKIGVDGSSYSSRGVN